MNVMAALAAARPGSLDPQGPDSDRRRRHLEVALSQHVERATHRRRPGRRIAFTVGLVATGAAAAVAVATVGNDTPTPGGRRSAGSGIQLAGQGIQLAAAKAEAQPMGLYWQSDVVDGQSYVVHARTGNYAITGAASEYFQWTSAKPGGGNLFYGRDLPARPQTPADVAAWHKAGSPTSFRVWTNDHYQTYTRAVGAWSADRGQALPGGRFAFTGFSGKDGTASGATVQDLQKLTTDPAALRQRYLQADTTNGLWATKKPGAARRVFRGKPGTAATRLLLRLTNDLANAPVPPRLRAGLMRMVATVPGVYSVGTVTDPLGRSGIGLATDWPASGPTYHGYGSRLELIFSKNGDFLAEANVLTKPGAEYKDMKPGFVVNYTAVRHSGWSDSKPTAPPASLPF